MSVTETSHLHSLRDFWRHFGLCRAAAHSDCCFFCAVYKYSYLLTYLSVCLFVCSLGNFMWNYRSNLRESFTKDVPVDKEKPKPSTSGSRRSEDWKTSNLSHCLLCTTANGHTPLPLSWYRNSPQIVHPKRNNYVNQHSAFFQFVLSGGIGYPSALMAVFWFV